MGLPDSSEGNYVDEVGIFNSGGSAMISGEVKPSWQLPGLAAPGGAGGTRGPGEWFYTLAARWLLPGILLDE
ncbi:hypothetical protein ES708_00212 [subsurface metagenome]